jgi:hypothetical protein
MFDKCFRLAVKVFVDKASPDNESHVITEKPMLYVSSFLFLLIIFVIKCLCLSISMKVNECFPRQ